MQLSPSIFTLSSCHPQVTNEHKPAAVHRSSRQQTGRDSTFRVCDWKKYDAHGLSDSRNVPLLAVLSVTAIHRYLTLHSTAHVDAPKWSTDGLQRGEDVQLRGISLFWVCFVSELSCQISVSEAPGCSLTEGTVNQLVNISYHKHEHTCKGADTNSYQWYWFFLDYL